MVGTSDVNLIACRVAFIMQLHSIKKVVIGKIGYRKIGYGIIA